MYDTSQRTCGRTATAAAAAGAVAAITDAGRVRTGRKAVPIGATDAIGAAATAVFTVILGSFWTTALNPLIGSAAYDTTRREPSGSIKL